MDQLHRSSGAGPSAGEKRGIQAVVLGFNEEGTPLTKQMDTEEGPRKKSSRWKIRVLPVMQWQRSAAAEALDTEFGISH